ncbi:Uncharacterised protein [Shigella sonnei]|nr:Uncharacterised protein [Shigella sonnei]CSP23792.1 Uncharacterised protein [Shigella sonnei]
MQFETGRADYPAVRFSNTRMRRVSCFEQRLFRLHKDRPDCFARHYGLVMQLVCTRKMPAHSLLRLRCHFCTSTQDYFAHKTFRSPRLSDTRQPLLYNWGLLHDPVSSQGRWKRKYGLVGQLFSARRWLAHYLYDGFYPRYTFALRNTVLHNDLAQRPASASKRPFRRPESQLRYRDYNKTQQYIEPRNRLFQHVR